MNNTEVKSNITPLDPDDRTTWENNPCPVNLSAIQEMLTQTGGVNDFGDPNFIIVYGQEYRQWDCGKLRIMFDDPKIPTLHFPNRFGVRPAVYSRIIEWLKSENERRKRAFMACDWTEFNRFPDVATYLRSSELATDYMTLPSDQENFVAMAKLLPPDWQFISGLHTYEHIGEQSCYVLQYFTPAEFGDPKGWDELRFGAAYYPETDRDESLIDILGEYPHKGRYEHPVIKIAPEINPGEFYGWKEPNEANVIPPLKELLKIRDRLTKLEKSPEFRTKKRFNDFRDNLPVNREKFGKRFREIFRDAKPVGRGNATNISANKNKPV